LKKIVGMQTRERSELFHLRCDVQHQEELTIKKKKDFRQKLPKIEDLGKLLTIPEEASYKKGVRKG